MWSYHLIEYIYSCVDVQPHVIIHLELHVHTCTRPHAAVKPQSPATHKFYEQVHGWHWIHTFTNHGQLSQLVVLWVVLQYKFAGKPNRSSMLTVAIATDFLLMITWVMWDTHVHAARITGFFLLPTSFSNMLFSQHQKFTLKWWSSIPAECFIRVLLHFTASHQIR